MKPILRNLSLLSAGALAGGLLGVAVAATAQKEEASSLPYNELRNFTEVFDRIKKDYVEPVDDKKLLEGAINGMLTSLDPHSTYLNKEAFTELKESTHGEFGGLGMEVGMEDGLVRITAPIEDTPAFKAGIKSGDLIFKIDDTAVRGLSLEQAVKKLRGQPGTTVTLTLLRKGEGKPLVLKLTRAIIKVKSIKSKLLEPGFGYVRITQFQERTTEDLGRAVTALYEENKAPLQGLVLDLRNDPGGLLDGAVGVAAAFLPKDSLVVYTEGRREDARSRLFARPEYYSDDPKDDPLGKLPEAAHTVPLVVLVNGGSASASEIVAGALQDHKRALIVGTQTFGKGSVQRVLPLNQDAAIKLTIAKYFTPKGRSIQAKGITPDVVVEETNANGEAIEDRYISEADLSGHLANPNGDSEKTPEARPAKPKASPKAAPASKPEKDDPQDIVSKNDAQLKQALTVLKVQQLLLDKNPAPTKP